VEESAFRLVELVRWPSEAVRRDQLAAADVPRLLLVEPDCPPPSVLLGIEDWIRLPADERDLFVRLARLEGRRSAQHRSVPVLEDLVLRFEDRWVSLPPVEAAIVAPLLRHFGELTTRDEIVESAWPDGQVRSLNSRIRVLRQRLAAVGLQLLTVRTRGFVVDIARNEEQDAR
jgi:DNA-binding response OmpR family regulator